MNKNKNFFQIFGVVPFFSQASNLNTDSNYQYLRKIIPIFLNHDKKSLFVIFFPNSKYGSGKWRYDDDGFMNISNRVKFVAWNYDTQMQNSVLGFDPLAFKKIDSQYGITIYWLQQIESAFIFKGGYEKSYNLAASPAIVSQHMYNIHPSLPGAAYKSSFSRMWAQLGSNDSSDEVVYLSDYSKKMSRDVEMEYFNSEKIAEFEKKKNVLHFGGVNGTENPSPKPDKNTVPIFIYNHRFEFYKNPKITFALFDDLRKKYKVKIYATQINGQNIKKFLINKSIYRKNRADYMEEMSKISAINTINSSHETFCISVLDSISVGHLVVLPNGITFPELVPTDYPFLFNSLKEQKQMVTHILENFADVYMEWSDKLIDFASEKFSEKKYVEKYYSVFEKASEKYVRESKHDRNIENVLASASGVMPLSVIVKKMQKITRATNMSGNTRRFVRDIIRFRNDADFSFLGSDVMIDFH